MAHLDDSGTGSPTAAVNAGLKNGADPSYFAERFLAFLIFAAAVGAWEWAARSGAMSTLFFPAPSEILAALGRSFASGELTRHFAVTLGRVGAGLVLGGVPGMLVGLLMGWSQRLRAFLDPFVAMLHPVPKIAVLPLFMIVFGIGEASKVVLVAVAVFFPMLINAMAGVRQIHAESFEAAEAFGAGRRQMLTDVVIPGSVPLIVTGTRLAFNNGLLLALAVEIVAAQSGLGRMIWLAWQTLRTEDLYAVLIVIAALGVLVNLALTRIGAYLAPWHMERVR